jgi:hypothetical protein
MRRLAFLAVLLAPALTVCAGEPAAPLKPPAASGLFEVRRTEEARTELDGREIHYKDRGPAKTALQVRIEQAAAERESVAHLLLFVPKLERESDVHGGKRALHFDTRSLDERHEKSPFRNLRANGTPREQESLRALAAAPWGELEFGGQAWTRIECTARDEAWPLADALTLERELVLLLPPLPSKLEPGASGVQAVPLPYPAPLSPAPAAVVHYRVEEFKHEGGRRVADVSFSGSADTPAPQNGQWGGIRLAALTVEATVRGRLRLDADTGRLIEASLQLDARVRPAGPEHRFSSDWKLTSEWKEARP